MAESVRYLAFLVATYYFLQAMGGNPGLHVQALQKFVKEVWQFSPAQAAAFNAFLVIPWMIKPLYGLVSDFLPILGSRRKSYFILMGLIAGSFYFLLDVLGTSKEAVSWLLFNAALAIAFSDVLCDAVMVEKGQPLNATDRLQSWQWFALGSAGVIIAFSKGYVAEYLPLGQAVRLSMLAPLFMVVFSAVALKEERRSSSGEAARQAWQGLKKAIRLKSLWGAAVFIFLFNCSPSLGTVLYYYEKDFLKFSDVLIGHIDTAGSIGFIAGTALFGLAAKRFSHEVLIRVIIVSGILSTLAYLLFQGAASGFLVSGIASIIGVAAFLGPLTLAAKVCPKYAEGTVFALLMSVANFGMQAGQIIGGKLYENIGYSWLVVISAAFTALMWFFLPLVRERQSNKNA